MDPAPSTRVQASPRTSAPSPVRGLALVCTAGVLWGTIGPAIALAYGAGDLPVLTIGAYRALVAVVVLLMAVLVTGRARSFWPQVRPQWRRVLAVGLLTASFQVLFFVSVPAAGVSVTTVVCLGLAPVLLLVLAAVRRRRPPAPSQVATVSVALLGLVLVALSGGASGGTAPGWGVLGAIAAGVAYATSAEVGAPLSQRLDIVTMTTATMGVAALALVPGGLLLPWLGGAPLGSTSISTWLLIAYLGVVTMALAYALLFAGLRSTPSGAAVVATLLEPVTAVLLAALLLGESLGAGGLLGTALILTAVGSLGLRQHPEPEDETLPQPQ